jgi:L-fuculose-phosphate aldolase
MPISGQIQKDLEADMSPDKKYENIFNEYISRLKAESVFLSGKCSISLKVSDILYAYAVADFNKPLTGKDIVINGMVSVSADRDSELHRLTYLNGKSVKSVIHAYPVNIGIIAEAGINIPPILDDMAQIIGPDAKCVEDSDDRIIKVLRKRNACIIKGNGVITYGRSPDEAYTACLVLEKSSKCFVDTAVLGGYRKIDPLEARLMHFVYKKKYSKQNQENKNKELFETKEKDNIEYIYKDKELELRQQIIDAGIKLLNSNLVQGTWGNISIRLDDNYLLITPSGMDYLTLKVEDIVLLNYHTMEYEGRHKPSGEKDIHAAIMRERKGVNAVIHSHPHECSSLAASHSDLPVMSDEMLKRVGGAAKSSAYALPSTKALAKATIKAIEGVNACIMANHGLLAVGRTIDDAFETCRVMEESAKNYINKRALEQSTAKEKRKDIFLRLYARK